VLTLVILYLGLFSTLAAHIARSLFQLTKKVVRPLIRAWFLRVVPARETTGCRENLRAPLPDRQKPVLIPSQVSPSTDTPGNINFT